MVQCHTCSQDGHVARDCTWQSETAPGARPPWCGECNPRTRLREHDGHSQRCHRCWAWPAKGTRFNQLLPQHQVCGGCGELVYAADIAPCGKHQALGIDAAGTRPVPAHADPAIAALARQAITREDHHA